MPNKSGFIPSEIREEVRLRSPIEQIIGETVTLKRVGSRLVGLCPFHQDTAPSFYVSPERSAYKCFGCGAHGDVFSFVMETQRLTYVEAVHYLADRCGVDIPENLRGESRPRGYRDRLYGTNESAVSFYREMLMSPEIGREAREYLRQRGLTRAMMEAFELGFAPGGGSALLNHFRKREIAVADAEATGLIRKRDRDEGHFDFFRQRLMCPVRNTTGKAVAFSGRILGGDGPKYINSTESDVFKKNRTFYALQLAKDAIGQRDSAIVCEGNFDVIALHQHDFRHAVAALGTAFTPNHADLLERYTKNVVFVFDGDDAGQKAMFKLVAIYAKREYQPRAVILPSGEDPDTFLKGQGAEELAALIENAPGLMDFALNHIFGQYGSDEESLARAAADACAMIATIQSPIRMGILAKSLAERTGLSESAVRHQVERASRGARAPDVRRDKQSRKVMPSPEWSILATLLHFPEVRSKLDLASVLSALPAGPALTLAERLAHCQIGGELIGIADLVTDDDDEPVRDMAASLLMSDAPCEAAAAAQTVLEAARRRDGEKLKAEIESVRKQRDQAREAENSDRADELHHRLSSLRKQLRMIRI
ncbi:MAG: DNA primase [Candidatus Lernaella stagnicola]|nr:DNA primase [Candidatus Lernaella stagnicola]